MSDEGNTEEEKTQVPELYTLIQLIVGINDKIKIAISETY